MTKGSDSMAKVASRLKVGGKVLGVVGGVFSIGMGIYDLCADPNDKCKDCDGYMTQDYCKRQCIACWTSETDNCQVSLTSNVGTKEKHCDVIC